MKKFFTLFLAFIFINVSYGQSFLDDGSRTNRNESVNRDVLDISGDIESNNFYVPGTTMNLSFTLNLVTPDEEYADMVTMTFPAGMTPNTGSNPFPGNTSSQTTPEALNPINNQVISWGDDDNNFGGITAPGSFTFFVNVTIDVGATGDMEVVYEVSGDEWAGSIHEFAGSVTVNQLPSTAELVVSPSGFIKEYYQVPFSQATFTPGASVKNIGSELSDPVSFAVSAPGGYADAMDLTIPMATEDEQSFVFAEFKAAAKGDFTFKFDAAYENDANPENNVYIKEIPIGNTLARDNGELAGNIGVGSAGGEMGNLFFVSAQDTLTSVIFAIDNTNNVGDVISVKVRSLQDGAPGAELGASLPITITADKTVYEAQIFPPLVMPAGNYYIGLVEGANNMQIAYTTTPFKPYSAWAYFNSTWNDLGAIGFEHTYFLRGVFDDVVIVENDIELVSIDNKPTYGLQDVQMIGTLRNLSTINTVTEFDINYSISGVNAGVFTMTGVNILPGGTYEFAHNIPYAAMVGFHDVYMGIGNPNGNLDTDLSNNILEGRITIVNEVYTRVVVGEEATGTWCGWCVRGHIGLKDMAHNYSNDEWIGIAVHNGDPMVDSEYDSHISAFVGGSYPSGAINREYDIDPGDFDTGFQVLRQEVPMAKVAIGAAEMDLDSRELSVDASSIFALDLNNTNYRMSMIVVEDGIVGLSQGYAQINYYASNGIPILDWEGIDWSTLGNPIPAADMVYDHVGRYIVGGWDGIVGSVPMNPVYNNANDFKFTTTLPQTIDETNVKVVVLLLDNDSGIIVNAAEKHIDVVSANVNIGNPNEINVYPNPTKDNLIINAKIGSVVTIYDLQGRVKLNTNMNDEYKVIDLENFESGSYIVKVLNNNTIYSKKVIVLK